jgi:hypothetical protein
LKALKKYAKKERKALTRGNLKKSRAILREMEDIVLKSSSKVVAEKLREYAYEFEARLDENSKETLRRESLQNLIQALHVGAMKGPRSQPTTQFVGF